MADFLEEKKREIAARLKELRPAVDEYHSLEGALRALEGVKSTGSTTTSRTTRRSSSSSSGGSGRRRGRPRGTGTRANQTLELVRKEPGITIPQLAEKMGIKQNYLYRVLPGLEQEGKVRKEGRGWHPKAAA
jgi:predicted Rossmann fold nucleotide-binding protein DprA/Smf involved in DNA uptake